MKPKPFSSENHFTVPVAMFLTSTAFMCCERGGACYGNLRVRYTIFRRTSSSGSNDASRTYGYGACMSDASWKAHREELDRRNAAAKKTAHEHDSPSDVAAAAREQRLARAEEVQLKKLNERINRGSRA